LFLPAILLISCSNNNLSSSRAHKICRGTQACEHAAMMTATEKGMIAEGNWLPAEAFFMRR
jgi:hypothetical protein